MAPMVPLEAPPSVDLGFSVLHQKVDLDIDLSSRSLRGSTELTISPHSPDLRTVSLNARQMELKGVIINGKAPAGVKLQSVYDRASLPWRAGVHQYHMLQDRIERAMRTRPEEELVVTLPRSLKIEELDPSSERAQSILLSKSLGTNRRESDITAVDLIQAPKTALELAGRFAPITLYVQYEIARLRDGIQFAGFEEGDSRYPHAYTTNSTLPGSACCLFPCVDNASSRCTWEISIKCPRTVGDAFSRSKSTIIKPKVVVNGARPKSRGVCDERLDSFSVEEKALDLSVICSGDMTDEIIDPKDPSRRTTAHLVSKEVSAQHIGFCIGPFEHVDLATFRESTEDDRLGQNAVPLVGYCLPGRIADLQNTCFPLAKAVDFFTMNYGSYPFSNYKVCFVDDAAEEVLHTAALSICTNRLLFPEDVLEPIDPVTRILVHALASQWIGIDIIAKDPVDIWAIVGISYFITDTFMRKLSGKNEYRFNQKKATDRVVELDVDRPSLGEMGPLLALDPSEMEFLTLKAPLVLFILDQRLIKAGSSTHGLMRVISRIFLNAKVGDLANSALDTPYFVRQCEKLGHTKLEQFFAQWVDGAGCPKFRVGQRFNKKKLVVEMTITQVQNENVKDRDLESSTFIRDVKEDQNEIYAGGIQNTFTGPMTIRIHEADGTPYEHIIEIKEPMQRVEIPYNTKYKRLKRSRRHKEQTTTSGAAELVGEDSGDSLLYSLGDVLRSEEEIKKWHVAEWTQEDEDRMSHESYEWIRMDADFEWICKMSLTMPGYMWVSQLQQDRDVVAQLESIQYLEIQKGHPLISTFLIRTLMDQRYFHGVRTSAALALSNSARDEFNWIGMLHLEKAYQELFCYPDSSMTRPNDFFDRAAYNVQKTIPQAIAKVKDASGRATYRVRRWLFEKLRYNDNSSNEFSDAHYVCGLMVALATAMATKPPPIANDDDDFADDGGDDLQFHHACLEEIDRHRRIDEWIPSYQNIVSQTALKCKQILAQARVIKINAIDFLQYTADGTSDILRLHAFSNLLELGLAHHPVVLRWFLTVLGSDPSFYIRSQMLRILGTTLGAIAIGEASNTTKTSSAPLEDNGGLIVETEASTEVRKADLARKQTVPGALAALREELSSNATLQEGLWKAITSPTISLHQMWQLLDICDKLYIPQTSMLLAIKYPRYWKCTKVGKGKVLFTRTDRIRTKPRLSSIRPPQTQQLQQQPQRPAIPPHKPFIKLKINATGSHSAASPTPKTTTTNTTSSTPTTVTPTPTSSNYPFLQHHKPPTTTTPAIQRENSTNSNSSSNISNIPNGTAAMPAPPQRTLLKPPKPPQSPQPPPPAAAKPAKPAQQQPATLQRVASSSSAGSLVDGKAEGRDSGGGGGGGGKDGSGGGVGGGKKNSVSDGLVRRDSGSSGMTVGGKPKLTLKFKVGGGGGRGGGGRGGAGSPSS